MRCMRVLRTGVWGDGSPQDRGGSGGSGFRPPESLSHLDGRPAARSIMEDRSRVPGRHQVRTTLPYFSPTVSTCVLSRVRVIRYTGHTTVRQPGAGIWAL